MSLKVAAQHSLMSYMLLMDDTIKAYEHTRIVCAGIEAFLRRDEGMGNILIIQAPPRHGKMMAHHTPILTTKGWSTHGDLKVGDEVFNPSGKPIKVIALGEDYYTDMEVTLSTGETFNTHTHHEWVLSSGRIVDTGQLRKNDVIKRHNILDFEKSHYGSYDNRRILMGKFRRKSKKMKNSDDLLFSSYDYNEVRELIGCLASFNVRFYREPTWVDDRIEHRIRYAFNGSEYRRRVRVTAISSSMPYLGRCIQVEGGEYLVGETLVVTHNSFIVSRFLPAWYLGNNPLGKVISVSHTAQLSNKYGGYVRDLIAGTRHRQVFGAKSSLTHTSHSKTEFRLMAGAEYFAAGVGKAIPGNGGNLLILDDPIKSRFEADSKEQMEKLKDWFRNSFFTRREKNGLMVIMHQRWAKDDIAGWVMKEFKHMGVQVINLPAVADSRLEELTGIGDSFKRKDGEALCPDLFSRGELDLIKQTMGNADYSSLYQQSPVAVDGNVFNRNSIRYYTQNPRVIGQKMRRYIIVDSANSKKKHSDFTAMIVIGANEDGNVYILDMLIDKFNLSEVADALFNLHRKWKCDVYYEKYGASADIEYMQYRMEQEVYNFSITPVGGVMPKLDRIRRLQPFVRDKRLYLPVDFVYRNLRGEGVEMTKYLVEDQLLPFPTLEHDDLIDCLARIFDIDIQFSGGATMIFNSSLGAGVR